MLMRTASTPALGSIPLPVSDEFRSRSVQNTANCDHNVVVTRNQQFRKVQSHDDLPALFCSEEDKLGGITTTQKQWSRRMSLTRHSSLPSPAKLDSILDEFQQQPLLPDLEESPVQSPASDSFETRDLYEMRMPYSGVSYGTMEQVGVPWDSRETRNVFHEEIDTMSIGGIGGIGGGFSNAGGKGGGHDKNVDAYYRRMLQEDPYNSLLLRNYAKYLHEVKGDLARAEEFYERAILASPDDAELRADYARLIWEYRKDEQRAASYFEQATRASPDDCSVLGAYAAFMWDVDEEEEHHRPNTLALVGPAAAMVSA